MEQANSILQYLELLERYSDYSEIYFRGQSEKYTSMPPSISRDEGYLENEGAIFNEATSMKAEEFIRLSKPIQKLSKLQHYGIPTRLVDLSLDPLISLFFAIQNVDNKDAGNIYVYVRKGSDFDDLNVRILSLLAILPNHKLTSIKNAYQERFGEYIMEEQILRAINEPIFIKHCEELKETNPRLYNQKGAFAICGNEVIDEVITNKIKSIDTITPTMVIRIPYEYKSEIKHELDEKYGINQVRIYPELPSVSDYIKEKYKKTKFNPDGKYNVIEIEDISHVMAKRISITLVLSEQLNIEQIRKVAIEVIEKNKFNNDVIWIYIAKNGDDYIMKNWIIRGQWINLKLDEQYRPLSLSRNGGEGYSWEESLSYSTLADYYSENVFEDDIILYVYHQKVYEEIRPIFDELCLFMQQGFINQIADLIKENKEKINCAYMQLGNFGHSRNKEFDKFLYNYIEAISSIDNIHFWIEKNNLNERALKYQIDDCIKDAKKYFKKIEQFSQKWYEKLNINNEKYDSIDPYNRPKKEYQYKQTIPVSQEAIPVTFNAKACINSDNTFNISGTTNLFDGANLMLSVYGQLNKLMGQSNADVVDGKFEFETFSMMGNGYEAGTYTANISLSISAVQKKKFTKLAGMEYENLTGQYVKRTGIGATVSYNFDFVIK
ncbi:FRG domain-containing protein [Clostridium botulinum]|uniref:FRG domain-containing protein n=1 Tax=Clostridium botulinum TaxID=1491 RepID=UPI00096DA6F7|nr:FRG domain-containing protein [Clostridium botulinum]NEZ74032.1 FRG domain-containing protein [Clostridium botulinum]NEZ98016.1 FRG domain-containing protein [Clostridium botulinum]NFA30748.1 FRG domain-containing protein [Clostridium botulinum]NFA83833.1 FRG domain-containing protein [Clostridium botulinum]NFB07676.1 FRG domain-containing protein [Clostridium botulinum]